MPLKKEKNSICTTPGNISPQKFRASTRVLWKMEKKFLPVIYINFWVLEMGIFFHCKRVILITVVGELSHYQIIIEAILTTASVNRWFHQLVEN